MTNDDTASRVRAKIAAHLGITVPLRDDQQIIRDLNGDGLDVVELVMAFEDEFSIEIPDEDFGDAGDDAITVGGFIALCQKMISRLPL